MPYPRNPFFTGREDVLTLLQDALAAGTPAALTQPQAISGLGGIGKTQTAVEYAYRHQDEYPAVFWVSAVDETTLREGFVEIARLLGLPQAQEADQSLAVQAVKAWLEREEGWLMILDNADDLPALRPFLPLQKKGHVLMTTRASATGAMAQKVEIGRLSEDDGALLLLRRAKLVGEKSPLDTATPADREAALALSHAVDGLPLALDQAGAFIEETPSTPARYLELYQTEAAELLAEYGNPADRDHVSVRVTFSLAFAKVAEASPAAGELMRFCAFLAPDAIPEEIFIEGDAALNVGANLLGVKALAWEKIVGEACRYSLLSRDANARTLSIHRLVQTVIRYEMDDGVHRVYAEPVVRAVASIFPAVEVPNWDQCERLLPHSRECAAHIANYDLEFQETVQLLSMISHYLHGRGQYREMMPLSEQALAICEKSLGPEHQLTASCLNNLARLHRTQGNYAQALSLYQRAVSIHDKLPESERGFPVIAQILNNLAEVYGAQGKHEEALSLHQRVLSMREKSLEPDDACMAETYNNLAASHLALDNYEAVEPMLKRALAIREKVLGPKHLLTAQSLNNLAHFYSKIGNYAQAFPLLQRALTIYEETPGPEHPNMPSLLYNLSNLYTAQGDYKAAEPLLKRGIAICEEILGPEHPDTATSLNSLARFYSAQGHYGAAEPLLSRVLAIFEKALGAEHPKTDTARKNYIFLAGMMNAR